MAKQSEAPKKGSKKELPDLTGKEFPRTCIVRDLADDEGDLAFYLIKAGKQKSRVFPQDPDRFVKMLQAADPSMKLEKTGYLVDTEKLDQIVDNSKKKSESNNDLDNLMAKMGLNKDGTRPDEEEELESPKASADPDDDDGDDDEAGVKTATEEKPQAKEQTAPATEPQESDEEDEETKE